MRLVVRWGVAIAVSLAAFAVSWWVCETVAGLDEGTAIGVAGATLAVVLAVAAWLATREHSRDTSDRGGGVGLRVKQSVRAGRDAYVAGEKQTVINYRHPGE